MRIESVVVETPAVAASDASSTSQVVVLEVSGVMDSSNDVVRRARELIGRTGSRAMAESFDWALEQRALTTSV